MSLKCDVDVTWIGPDVYWFENEPANDGISRALYKSPGGLFGRLINNYKALKCFRRIRKNIDFVYLPDPDAAFFFTLLFRGGNTRILFDIHEVYHKYLLNNKVNRHIYPVLNYLLKKAISRTVRKADLTMAVSDTVSGYYASDAHNCLVIRNCLPLSYGNLPEPGNTKKKIFTLVHGKNHPTRGTMLILDAMRILKEKGIFCKVLMIDTKNILFDEYVREHDLMEYIDLHDGLPFVEMINQMLQCHAGLIAYGRDLGVDSLPNRVFEYMALGLPVIVPEYSIEMFKMISLEKCGLTTDTEAPERIAESIDRLVKNPELAAEMGERGRRAFLERHNWEKEVSPLIQYLTN